MIKPDAKDWVVKEQIIDDLATGLQIQFERVDDSSAPFRLRIYGKSLPFGNREILFDGSGAMAGGGTALSGDCKPAWLTDPDEL